MCASAVASVRGIVARSGEVSTCGSRSRSRGTVVHRSCARGASSPLDQVLGAFVACNQVTSAIVAQGQGIELGQFSGRVEAELDNSVLVYGAEGNPNFSRVALTVELETHLDDAAFDVFVAEVTRRCPLTQLFVRSGVEVTTDWKNRVLASA